MRTRLVTGASIAVLLVLTGCASSDASHSGGHASPMMGAAASSSAAPDSGAAAMGDVMFAQMMIPHHAQAVEMSDLALANPDTSPQVRELATDIKAAQQPEIDQMNAWLEEWGFPGGSMMDEDGHDMGDHSGHDMDGMGDMDGMSGMDGMMTEAEMKELESATGATFNRLWLDMMIRHHEGAIEMANDVLATSTDPRVIELGEAIVASQTTEIATMKELLAAS
jgi:uncharacterized protein (DUF305 family)